MTIKSFLISTIIFVLVSCQSDSAEPICYSFDLRSCNTDPWSDSMTEGLDNKIKSYLNERGIEVIALSIDMGFHQVVCLACEVCPAGPRIYVSINENSAEAMTKENLLSLASADCSQVTK